MESRTNLRLKLQRGMTLTLFFSIGTLSLYYSKVGNYQYSFFCGAFLSKHFCFTLNCPHSNNNLLFNSDACCVNARKEVTNLCHSDCESTVITL